MKLFQRRSSSAFSLVQQLSRKRIVFKSNSGESLATADTTQSEESASYCDSYHGSNSLSPLRLASQVRSERHCRVQFASPEQNQIYDSQWILVKETTPMVTGDDEDESDGIMQISEYNIWYQTSDIRKFKHDTEAYARLIHDLPWSTPMWTAYQGFLETKSVDQMNTIMDTSKDITLHPFCVGLEKWIRECPRARSRQRKTLYAALADAQAKGASTRTLRRISRETSRSSRLFAHYLGCCVQEEPWATTSDIVLRSL